MVKEPESRTQETLRRGSRKLRGRRGRSTQNGGALHSPSSDLSDVDADRPFAGMAFDKMRRPGD